MQIGYWSVPITSADTNYTTSVTPYITGAWPYLLRALGWARKHGVHVILDLHGAPGSQNGYDNSGQRTNNVQWVSNPDNIPKTLDVIKFLAQDVGDMVAMVELLNEAAGYTSSDFAAAVRQYWLDGYKVVRDAAGSDVRIMIGDAFLGVQSWQNFMRPPDYQGVMLDIVSRSKTRRQTF